MPTRQLYNIRIPQDSQTNSSRDGLGRELSTLAGLQEDVPSVEELGVNVGDQSIDASYANKYAAKIAAELEELFTANGFTNLPYYTPSDPGRSGDSYVAIEDGSVETASVHEDRVQVVSATFTREGTAASHRRTVRIQPSEVHRNDFGNDETAYVAIPSSASKRTWYNKKTQAREAVTVESTVEGELADVDIIDASAVSLTAPYELVYNVSYDAEYQAGIVVWDTRPDVGYGAGGYGAGTYGGLRQQLDSDGDLRWMKCYRTDHEFRGSPVIDTGRLRILLTPSDLHAQSYDPTTDTWTAVGLPESDWRLSDVDVTTISPVKVEAQCEFTHPSNGVFALNMVARRGREVVHWLVPESVDDVTPVGLVDYLDGIADSSVVRPQSSHGLIAREEIRR